MRRASPSPHHTIPEATVHLGLALFRCLLLFSLLIHAAFSRRQVIADFSELPLPLNLFPRGYPPRPTAVLV